MRWGGVCSNGVGGVWLCSRSVEVSFKWELLMITVSNCKVRAGGGD